MSPGALGPAGLAGTLPELAFTVHDAGPQPYAAVPTLRFALGIENVSAHDVRSILLDVQIGIAARRRPYGERSHDRLFALFGPPEAWGTTLRTLLWHRLTVIVPPMRERTMVDLLVPCTYDLDVTASRYFASLEEGEVPLEFLFSGTVFHTLPDGRLQTARISHEQEAGYRLPVSVWRATMDQHFPGSAWLRLRTESFDRLAAYRSRNALATWDDAVDALLARTAEE
jgi:hypothetical protein